MKHFILNSDFIELEALNLSGSVVNSMKRSAITLSVLVFEAIETTYFKLIIPAALVHLNLTKKFM